jgi:hypothetical protein
MQVIEVFFITGGDATFFEIKSVVDRSGNFSSTTGLGSAVIVSLSVGALK